MRIFLIIYFLLCHFLGHTWGRLISPPPRGFTLPLRLLPRDRTNVSTVAGITPVAISSDRQTYFAILQTGAVYFRVALDTASSDLWITGDSCSTPSCTAVPRFPLAYQSPTFGVVNNNQTVFTAKYADGTAATGFVARESVRLANITLPNQVFAIVTDSNVTMKDDVSGILGLGFPRLSSIFGSANNSAPFFPSLAQKGLLDYPLFGLSLTNDATGSLSLGAIDTTIVANTSKISWNKVVEFAPVGTESNTSSYLHWVTPLAAFAIGDKRTSPIPTYPKNTGNSSLALFDIGTPGIFGPYQDVERLFAQIDGSRLVDPDGLWAIPCDTTVRMSFTFGDQTYTLDPTDFLIGPASGNPQTCLSWPRALLPSGDGIDWQFGGPFLRTVYSIFSYGINYKEAPHIGFYPLKNVTDSNTVQPSAVEAFLSSVSATVTTTLPNALLSTPSVSTPGYRFNSSIQASTGGIVTSALATSTYNPIFGPKAVNVSGLPAITPDPTATTIVFTNSQGEITTSTSIVPSVTLGVPPGWRLGSAATIVHISRLSFGIPLIVLAFVS